MKIARLDLHAFGPFTQATLDFTRTPGALQLVYGPNEAGKSSTLRALTALFYGVPVRTGDAHVHEMSRLRVGATLLDAEGRALQVIRRKGAKNTLLDGDEQPIDDGTLRTLLGGLDESLFRQMFGLDHEHLRAGGEALLAGEGQLGETLFSAGTGARGISKVMASLRAELDLLYKPRGGKPKLNAALESLKACQRRTKDAMLSPQAFLDQQQALDDARTARDRALSERRAWLAEQSRLTRALQILPVLRRRQAIVDELRTAPAQAGASEEDAKLGELLRSLERRHGRVLGALEALPERQAERSLLERDIAELRARLGSAAQALRALETPMRARLRQHADEARALVRELAELARSITLQTAALAQMAPLEASVPAWDAGALAELVALAERSGLALQLPQLASELARRSALIESGIAQLGLTCDAATLARLALPDESQVAELEAIIAKGKHAVERLHESEARCAQQAAQLAQRRAALLADGMLPSLRDLKDARRQRGEALEQLLADVQQHGRVEASCVAQLRTAIGTADALADQLAREAQRAAEWRQLEVQQDALAAQQQQDARDAEALATLRVTVAERTRALLAPLGLGETRPQQARAALTRLSALVAQATEHAALVATHGAAHARAVALATELAAATGAPRGTDDGDVAHVFAQALEHARRLLVEARDATREREAREARRADLAEQLALRVARQAQLQQQQQAFQELFESELSALGFPATLAPDEVLACLDDLALLSQKTRDLGALVELLAAEEVERRALTADVRRALARHAPENDTLDVEAALAELSRRHREQLAAKRDGERLRTELAAVEAQLHALGDGASLEELSAALVDFEPHAARARLEELTGELERVGECIGDLEQTVGRLEAGVELLQQTAGASSSAEELESELSRARAVAREYYEARIALSILQREVERYRTEHQGPVLARAGALFPRLTLQRYSGLSVEYDDRDEPVLSCLRHDGRSVRVTGLSDGTRDQLYFALRVASIERFLESNPPLPLILDDAFIHFDDARAAAALEVLGELCTRTQVVFFTHHARMVELALRALGRERVSLHQLPRAAGVIARADDGPLFS